MMSTFTMFLMSWLLVGFLVGVKAIYVRQVLTEERIEELKEKLENDPNINHPQFAQVVEKVFNIMTNKKSLLAVTTLFGYFALYLEIKRNLMNIKKFFTKKRNK